MFTSLKITYSEFLMLVLFYFNLPGSKYLVKFSSNIIIVQICSKSGLIIMEFCNFNSIQVVEFFNLYGQIDVRVGRL